MRILFFSHYFPPEVNAPASRTYENCKRWMREGHEVTVITCAPNCPDGVVFEGYRNRLRRVETIDGIRVVRVWSYIAANKGTVRRIANYVSYMLSAWFFSFFEKRPDVVIATSPQFFCGWAGVLCSWFRRLRFVLEVRDIWPESIIAVGAMQSRRLVRVLEWLEARMYRAARHIVTVGEGYRERLIEKGVPEAKISIVMNGVDPEIFSPREADPALKAELGIDGKFVCSYVGTIGMACALGTVLDAAEALRGRGRHDIAFLLVGDGAVREELETDARRRGLDNVVFTGRLPKERVPDILALSGACLVHLRKTPLFRTVMPSKVFEAAGMARPIVNGVEGFAARMVEDNGAGLCFEPENAEQLARTVERLADDPALCRALGQAGYRNIAQRYNRDTLAAEYLATLERVAKKRASRP